VAWRAGFRRREALAAARQQVPEGVRSRPKEEPEGTAMPSAAPISIWDLFQNADIVVKLVMVGLLIASISVWAIAIEKFMLY
jgi:biopolymer transport protein TolQ